MWSAAPGPTGCPGLGVSEQHAAHLGHGPRVSSNLEYLASQGGVWEAV